MRKTFWMFLLLIVALGIYSIFLTPLARYMPEKESPQATVPDQASVIAAISAEDNGPLQQCTLNNTTYYFARGSAFDGSDNIYDARGASVAQCGGGWGVRPEPYPAICEQMYTATCTDITQQQ